MTISVRALKDVAKKLVLDTISTVNAILISKRVIPDLYIFVIHFIQYRIRNTLFGTG